ncbi:MAG: hypothetical protein ACFN39_10435 [Lacticaseibacillus rhamnosus]
MSNIKISNLSFKYSDSIENIFNNLNLDLDSSWKLGLVGIKAFNCKFCRLTLTITRSPAQIPACKDLGRNGQNPAITPKATYTPVSDRAGSRSL